MRQKQFWLLVHSIAMGLAFCELALRAFAPIGDPFMMVNAPGLNLTLSPDPELLPGTTAPSHFSTDRKGFRVSHAIDYENKPANVRRIFLLGGSTTESFYIDDKRTFGALLEQRLNGALHERGLTVEVINTGRAGTSSADHYYVARQLTAYDPDLLVYLIGINEMWPYLKWHYQPTASEFKGKLRSVVLSSQLLRRGVLLYRLRGAKIKEERDATGAPDAVENPALAPKAKLVAIPEIDKELPAFFFNNLRLIADLHRHHGIKAIMMTQPTMWGPEMDFALERRIMLDKSGALVRYSSTERLDLLERYNDELRRMGMDGEGLIYCLDLARLLPKDRKLYFNDIYFSNLGHERTAETMARFILDSKIL